MKRTEYIYFNNSASSYPKPQQVIRAVSEYIGGIPLHAGRGDLENNRTDIVFETRKLIAQFINAPKPENIIFTSGATESLNLAIFGLECNREHIITTTTEHNSVLRPLKTLEKGGEIRLSVIHCDISGYVEPENIANEISPDTRAIIINHSSNVTGTVQNIDEISKIAHKNNCLLIVDASQSIGAIDIDVTKTEIDILCFTGHKNLFGLQGTGGIYIKEGLRLKPLKVGGTGVRSDYLYQPESVPIFYEAGTPNMTGILSMKAGLEFILATGMQAIRENKTRLFERLISGLMDFPEIIFYGDSMHEKQVPVLAFNIKSISPADVTYILQHSYNILTRSGLHCAPLIHSDIGCPPEGNIRVSLSYFNTIDEIDIFLSSISQIIQEFKK